MIDLEFAKSIGAKWYSPEYERYYKVQNNELVWLAYGDDGWVSSMRSVDGAKVNIDKIDYTPLNKEKEMKGHPHADLAIQYWIEAKEDVEAWRNWELMEEGSNKWGRLTTHPSFRPENQYRRKPKTHFVHGVEIPDLRASPGYGNYYYLADPTERDFTCSYLFHEDGQDSLWVERGLVYQHSEEGKQAAIKHALAMLGFDSVEEMEATLGGSK